MLSPRQISIHPLSETLIDSFYLKLFERNYSIGNEKCLRIIFICRHLLANILFGDASTLRKKRMEFFLVNVMVKIIILNTNLKALSVTFMFKNCTAHGYHLLKWIWKIKASLEALHLFHLLLENYLYISDVKLSLEKIWLGLNANRSQSSLFHEIKTMLENSQLLFLGESAIHLSNMQNIYWYQSIVWKWLLRLWS